MWLNFLEKGWSLVSVKLLLHKPNTTGSADRKPASGRRRTARTDESVNRVEDHLKERLSEDWRRFDQSIVDRAVNQWRGRLCQCIRAKGRHFEHVMLNILTVSTDINCV